jgi:hypothetical protein
MPCVISSFLIRRNSYTAFIILSGGLRKEGNAIYAVCELGAKILAVGGRPDAFAICCEC